MAQRWQQPFSQAVAVLLDRRLPEPARPVGYAALIDAYGLSVPPPRTLSAIGPRHRIYARDGWRVLTPRHEPAASLAGHLIFAVRHEGLDLAVLKRLFVALDPDDVTAIVRATPTGIHARRIWFLYEWLTGRSLDLPDVDRGSYTDAMDPARQWAAAGVNVRRQRVRNNLPGTPAFCPLVFRTPFLEESVALNLGERVRQLVGGLPGDLAARTSVFLLIEDSKASYVIEGERPPRDRLQRWAVRQNAGALSRRRRAREFAALTDHEFAALEAIVRDAFDVVPLTGAGESVQNPSAKGMSKHPPSRLTIEESVRCPLLDRDPEGWIRCCTARFLPLARRVAGDDAAAHDALQESWIIVLQKLRQYQGGPPACSWVAAIVRHEALHGSMAERRDLPLDADSEPAAPGRRTRRLADAASPEAAAYSRELTRVLLEVIDELQPAYRDVVRLRDLEDRPPDEVARRLHLSRENVAVRLHRAHRSLRRIVERRLFGAAKASRRDPKENRESL